MCFRLIDGQVYDGVVKAKEQARKEYTHAVTRGQSAGLVRYIINLLLFCCICVVELKGRPFF